MRDFWHRRRPPTGGISSAIERTTEPKIVLLVRLLNAIDEGRHSFEGLKDRLAESGGKRPSTRSLRRYLAVLGAAEFPWHFDRTTNTYRFADGYSLKRLQLSSGELFGLVALRSIAHSIGGAIGASIGEVTGKLAGSSGSGARAGANGRTSVAFRLSEIRLEEPGERAFALLSAAERASRSVRFAYVDKDGNRSTRTVDPYGFVVSSGRIYCVAYDHVRRDRRSFAVDSISEVATLAQTFVKPPDFDVEAWAASSISGVIHSGSPANVRVRFAPRVAKAAVAAHIVAERDIERRDDGSAEIVFHVDDADELVRWILGWGDQAEILDPPELRSRIATLAHAISQKYR
ncbi:MAG TPA: WYL domain-containing protein [Candidatus Tyrphobacter sp.]